MWPTRRAQQQAELQPKGAEVQALRDSVLTLTQELDRAAGERKVLEAAREKARATALETLTEHGQVSCQLAECDMHLQGAGFKTVCNCA